MNFKQPRKHDKKYLGLVAQLPSVLSGKRPVHVCHVRYGDLDKGKRHTGMGEKPDDMWTVPLTPDEHQFGSDAQHKSNEKKWWEKHGIDPIALCKRLYAAYEAASSEADALAQMESIVMQARVFRKVAK